MNVTYFKEQIVKCTAVVYAAIVGSMVTIKEEEVGQGRQRECKNMKLRFICTSTNLQYNLWTLFRLVCPRVEIEVILFYRGYA